MGAACTYGCPTHNADLYEAATVGSRRRCGDNWIDSMILTRVFAAMLSRRSGLLGVADSAHSPTFPVTLLPGRSENAVAAGECTSYRVRLSVNRKAILSLCTAIAFQSASAASMVVDHQFAVSESGAVTVNIPIKVPRGIGGMEPQLGLNFGGGAGNGLLGLGWALSGPSTIARCPKTRAVDGVRGSVNFDANDQFCLDGQRLLLKSGLHGRKDSLYVTERDGFSRIRVTAEYTSGTYTHPASFSVETKAGLTMHFGVDGSQVMVNRATEENQPINRWMLGRIEDRHGSDVRFYYCDFVSEDGTTCSTWFYIPWTGADPQGPGSKVLHYIRYTNRGGTPNGQFAVVFGYSNRPDRIRGYHAGSRFQQAKRLTLIETRRDFNGTEAPARGKLVRQYRLNYEAIQNTSGAGVRATTASRLASIVEMDASGQSLPPLTFTYAPDAVFGKAVAANSSLAVGAPQQPLPCGAVVGDRRFLECR